MEIKKFENSLIAFDTENEIINATDMIKHYPNKRMNDYLKLKSTKEYQKYLESETGNPATIVKQGGIEQGTWMCHKMALDFASWLDVKLRDFIYDTFLDTLRTRIRYQQMQLDHFWDREDQKDLYPKY
jgi:hypothetical protein